MANAQFRGSRTGILAMANTPSTEVVSPLGDPRAVFTPPPERSQVLSRFRMESPLRVMV